MNLDEIINEAGYSYLNSMLGSGKKNHGVDLFAYENWDILTLWILLILWIPY